MILRDTLADDFFFI